MNIGYNALICKDTNYSESPLYIKLDTTPREMLKAIKAGIPIIFIKYSEYSDDNGVGILYYSLLVDLLPDENDEYEARFYSLLDMTRIDFRAATLDGYFVYEKVRKL